METAVDKPITNGLSNGHAEEPQNKGNDIKQNGIIPHSTSSKNQSELDGPNQVLPATEFTCTKPDGRVKLRMGKSGLEAETPLSIPGILNRTVARYPDMPAYAVKEGGVWKKTTFSEYKQQIRTIAKAFLKVGLVKHHSVCILGFNSPQWFISDLAAIHAGGFAAGIYTTNNPEACFHVLNNSRANIVVVEDTKQMDKVLEVWPRLPHLKIAVQWDGKIKTKNEKIITWDDLVAIGEKEPDTTLNNTLKEIAINECCTLVYTSGTVGLAKGVMLSHDNIYYESLIVSSRLEVDYGNECTISFLPLSHVAAQILDIHMPMMNAVTVYFADKDALKGSLLTTLLDVRPTRFLAVPRVWEKIYDKMSAIAASNGYMKNLIAGWAKQQALNYHLDQIAGIEYEPPYMLKLARWLVLGRVHAALGLDRCCLSLTAAAPLASDIKRYFLSLDIPLMDIFGMSESAGAHTLSTPDCYNLNSVGRIMDGVETMIYQPDPVTKEGEIYMRGRHIFMGYLDEPQKTKDALDEDGWLHSGDIGKTDEKRFMYITGRSKEILITAGGENVAPVPIEQQLKTELPCISQAVVIGDRLKFLSVLLSFKCHVNSDNGSPLDTLSEESTRWLKNIGSTATTVTEVRNPETNQNILKAIEEGIVRANSFAVSNAQKIQKFAIIPADLSTHTGELGPTLKIKRNVVVEKYKDIIASLYN